MNSINLFKRQYKFWSCRDEIKNADKNREKKIIKGDLVLVWELSIWLIRIPNEEKKKLTWESFQRNQNFPQLKD